MRKKQLQLHKKIQKSKIKISMKINKNDQNKKIMKNAVVTTSKTIY